MTLMDLLRTEIGERVEHSDFLHGTMTAIRNVVQKVMNDFVVGDGGGTFQALNYILNGFSASAVGTVVTVVGGRAMVGLRSHGTVEHGMLVAGGAASRSWDMNSQADGTYGVFIRAEFLDSRNLNRLFWNPIAAPPVETPRNVPTRSTEDWSLQIELLAPGPEWIQVATAAKTGAAVVITDTRPFLLDTADGNIVDGVWGSANDRSTNRASFGIKGIRRLAMALEKQTMNIIGGLNWAASPQSGTSAGSNGPRSLTQLNDEKLARGGTQTMTGNLNPNADQTLDQGSAGTRWRDIFARIVNVTTRIASSANLAANIGEAATRFNIGYAGLWNGSALLSNSYVEVLGNAPSPIDSEPRLWADTIPRMWLHVQFDAANGFTVNEGVGITPSLVTGNQILRCTFDEAFVSADEYVVLAMASATGAGSIATEVTGTRLANRVDIQFTTDAGALVNLGASTLRVNVLVIGRVV